MARGGFEALDPCVHCGFCLPACPTYLATGDESDSPRGRILLMRALERGELPASDPALQEHLGLCLGCRGCEPVCPAGVGYGHGLEAARERLAAETGIAPSARFLLSVFRRKWRWRPLLTAARWFRATGIPRLLAGSGRVGFGMGMLEASAPVRQWARGPDNSTGSPAHRRTGALSGPQPHRPTVALFTGCVMDTLFSHVHAATRRVLEANGYQVVEVSGQTCCGALHEHAGDRAAARVLLAANLEAFAGKVDVVAVNSAGCGAWLRAGGEEEATAARPQGRTPVRDVTELLAEAGPRAGAPFPCDVAYDPPCHLEHAQGVRQAPLALFAAIPELRLARLPGAERCCGSAGLYGLLHREMSRAVLADKIATIRAAEPRPDFIATGNPGCLMQIGAGLRAEGLPIGIVHPVELLDESYRRAGFYGRN